MATDDIALTDSNIDKLANAISQGIAATAPKKVTLGQYLRRKPVPVLKYECSQNGFHIVAKKLTEEQASYLNRIVRPGRYINRLVEVALYEEGGAVHLDLRYTNNTPDTRFELKNHFRNFTELVKLIVEEQDVILAKVKRQESAVAKLMAQNDAEEAAESEPEEELPRIESLAQTPRQEAQQKKAAKRAPFSSARIRKAQADAGL